MASIRAPKVSADLTADGSDDGYVTVASNAGFHVGATVYLRSDTEPSTEYVVASLKGSGQIGLREIRELGRGLHYGRNPVDQWLIADNATITMPAQLVVRVEE